LIWTHGVSAYATQRTNGEGRKLFSGVTEIKTMPYVPLSHPFVERLIGALRRECLDRTLFWTATDLEAKLLDFQHYYNEHRTHAGRQGHLRGVNADHSLANLSCYPMAEALSGLIPNADCRLSLVIRHRWSPIFNKAALCIEHLSNKLRLPMRCLPTTRFRSTRSRDSPQA
jgi:hypothetical protein